MSDSRILSVKPIIHYPRVAQVGKTYLMTIDLEMEENFEWQYEEEEYPIYCTVDSALFSSKPIGEPVVVLHRFGGSYGKASFLLTAKNKAIRGGLGIALANKWGVLIKTLEITNLRTIKQIEAPLTSPEDLFSSSTLEDIISELIKKESSQETRHYIEPRNAIKHFLETISPSLPGITCPACGSILSIQRPSSTKMILTENTRLELDGYLASYRRFLEKLELMLEQQSVEFNRGGVYTGTVAEPVIDKLVQEFDFFEWIEGFSSFSCRIELSEGLPQDVEAMFQKARNFLGSLEPRSIADPLMDLVLDQTYVASWCEKILMPSASAGLDALLNDVCPAIQEHLHFIRDINQPTNAEGVPFSQRSQPDQKLEEGIIRVQFILAILLGHHSKRIEAVFLNEIGITLGVPFTLPRTTIVSPKRLQELLYSEPVLNNPRIGLSQDLLHQLKQDAVANSVGNGEQISLEGMTTNLKREIHQFIHFTCTGSVDDQPNAEPIHSHSNSASSEETCDWYPKPEPTHSVILLGSPGTGKSSAMLTGFTTFYDNIFALGATISFDSPEDEVRMKRLNEDYWAGNMPSPTAKGSRTTIKLAVDFPEQGYPRTNYVFTDFAGEVMVRSLTHEGSDPSVLRILKNAETIVFFFDISIEPSIRLKLTEGDDGTWKELGENFARLRKSHIVKNLDGSKAKESIVEVSQLQLLQRLIRDLKIQRGTEDLKSGYLNFICVIPKADLFASEDLSNKRNFFSDFYKSMIQESILVQSTAKRRSLSNMRSIGGLTSKTSNPIMRQKAIAKFISLNALKSLSKIGDGLNDDTAEPIKSSLVKTFEVGLIANLNNAFGDENVYFLPVSIGQTSEHGSTFSPKLTEYVFILPIVLSVNSQNSFFELEDQAIKLNLSPS